MPSLFADTRLLGLYAGIPTETPGYIFLQTGQAGTLGAYFQYLTGSAPLFTLNGKVLYSNTGVPSSSLGSSGDFFISESLYKFYGPKSGASWGAGVNIQGPTGATGPAGSVVTGVAGSGVPVSGERFQVLAKASDSSYDTSWLEIGDLNRGYFNGFGGRPSRYTEVFRNTNLRGSNGVAATGDMGSGVTYNPVTNTLFVADNGTPSISEYSIDGQFIRTINLSGFKDIEAIDYISSDYATNPSAPFSTFVIAEEYNAAGAAYLNKLHVIEIAATGSVTVTNNPGVGTHVRQINLGPYLTSAAPNVGIEGVTYNADHDIFYVVTEKTANEGWKVWRVANNSTVDISEMFDLTTILGFLSPPATDISDICYRRSTNSIVMTSEEGAGWILEFNLTGGLLDYMVAPSAFFQLEGICFSADGNLMFLTGEANSVGGDKPDYMIFEGDRTKNPTTDERSHGLNYFQNGVATSVRGKLFELIDPYSTTVNNTNKSLVSNWPIGSRDMKAEMMRRGRKLSFTAYGTFVPSTVIDVATLYFGVQDTGNVALTPALTVTGVSCAGVNSWNYFGNIAFSEAGFYNNSRVEIHNTAGYSSSHVLCQSGLSSSYSPGEIDFVTKFAVPSTVGTLNMYQFSMEID